MRLRRSRTETYYHKKRIVEKNREGSTRESYGTASSVEGESWPASGKVQTQQYGERLNYIRNVRISGKYEVKPDEKGKNALYSREWYRHSGIRWDMSLCWKRCSAGLQDHLY